MTRHFTAEIRVLLCEGCGAPLEAPVAGGPVACSYCRVQNIVTTRDERPTLGMPAVPVPVDEGTRLARLRMQDGKPLVPPASIMYLLAGSSFDPSKVQEAFMVYQATRKEVKTTSSPDAAERLYFLTLVANNYYTEHDQPDRRRAILETSLDTLFLPRHKQVIRGLLASAAAKEGDMQAAERWLGPCDARSEDLESDSAWRNARAYLDTIKGDYRAVVAVLGARDDEIPIMDARDPVCAVLRANALEKLGDVQAAVDALRTRMGKENAAGRHVIEEFVAKNPQLHLCPQSLPVATAAHTEVAAQEAASGAGGGVGSLLFFIGLGLLVLTAVLFLGGLVPVIGAVIVQRTTDPSIVLVELLGGAGLGLTMGIGPGIAGVIMTLIGFGLRRSAQDAAYLRRHGIRMRGVIQGIEATGTSINDVPLVKVKVMVKPQDRSPYEASFQQLLSPQLASVMQPGREVPLRVHPQQPEKILLELA